MSELDASFVSEPLPLVVSVRLRRGGPVHDFDPGSLVLARDDRVLVETDRGPALGTVVGPPLRRATGGRLHRVLQLADPRDLSVEDDQLQRQQALRRSVLEVFRDRGLPIKLVKVEHAVDGTRALVYYASEERYEHRELARELSGLLGIRVEMRQIGARDEAKTAGGIGVCGRELCCSSWLREFQAVSVKMAKAQGLALNFSKLAGQCGRLKCCMRYEYQTYLELRRELPAVGKRVETVKGNGEVVSQSLLKQIVRVRRDQDGELVDVTLDELVEQRRDG
ncbi:MAG TPA: regulatory iron-sulfur-containing complex subunit RicT [Candidatus Limnocylindria bacterium]|nr:regulatory iron-sulfur-containing complex subunit RicT [Candidatus Limnocylindria bacterium]